MSTVPPPPNVPAPAPTPTAEAGRMSEARLGELRDYARLAKDSPDSRVAERLATDLLSLLTELDATRRERAEWIVIASGHGSRERPNYPPLLQTKAEAERDAEKWICTADTIGGTASVVRAVDYIAQLHQQLVSTTRARDEAQAAVVELEKACEVYEEAIVRQVVPLSLQMVERAARAWYEVSYADIPWERLSPEFAQKYRRHAAQALTAALTAPADHAGRRGSDADEQQGERT